MPFKKLATAAALGTLLVGNAFAGSFDGPFIQGGIGAARSETEIKNYTHINSLGSKTSFIGQIAGGYSQSFGDFNLAASLFYDLGKQKAGDKTYAENPSETYHWTTKLKNTWGLAIEPGWNLTPSLLLYAKLAYVQSKGESKATHLQTGASNSGSRNLHGFGYGLGAKYLLNKNIYALAEIQQTDFQKKSIGTDNIKVQPDSLTAIFGVGYKF